MSAFAMLFAVKQFATKIISFLATHWRLTLAAVVLCSLGLYINHLRDTVDELTRTVIIQKNRIAVLTRNNEEYQRTISSVNKQVEDLNARTKKLTEQSKDLSAKVTGRIKTVIREVEVIKSLPTPTTCPDAIDFMIKNAPKGSQK